MGMVKNMLGQRFGRLLVTEEHPERKVYKNGDTHAQWVCKCDCGKVVVVPSKHLRQEITKSCGCLHIDRLKNRSPDITGKRFGLLVAIRLAPQRSDSKRIKWLCKCDCGNEVVVRVDRLVGKTDRKICCGCTNSERSWGRSLLPEKADFKRTYSNYQANAKTRNLLFELTEAEFHELTQKDCFYCGAKPANGKDSKHPRNGAYIYNGIDRLDNNEGYIMENCITACHACNYAKTNLSVEAFLEKVKEIRDWAKRLIRKQSLEKGAMTWFQ